MTEQRIGIVLSDVDGTQIRPHHRLPSPGVQTAARQLRRNNVYLAEVTSRSYALLSRIVQPHDLLALRHNLCTLDGGATVAHADTGEVVWSEWLSAGTKRTVVTALGKLCTRVGYDMITRRQEPHEVVAALEREEETETTGAPAIFAVFGAAKADAVLTALEGIPRIVSTPVMRYDKDQASRCIQFAAVDKQHGVTQLLRFATMAGVRALKIADGENDVPLFAAGEPDDINVAMGDAPEELKDLADWVAPSAEQDGFRAAMEHYGLIGGANYPASFR